MNFRHLLPGKRDPVIVNKLSSQYQSTQSRTVKFTKSFIPFRQSNYQRLWRFISIFIIVLYEQSGNFAALQS